MPKPKQFLKDNKKKSSKHAPRLPSSIEEYLEDGVAFEEAGEKWRGGDATKSTRFFVRAIDCYDEGLKKFPQSFDLAYNKARIQFELTQYPKLLQQLPGSLIELLQTALESTRWALKLNPEDANTLFNTAQILTSLFEADEQAQSSQFQESLQLLEEALQLLSKCLARQEEQARLSQAQEAITADGDDMDDSMDDALDTEEGGVSLSDTSSAPQDDRWATIVEPVTNDTILDTLLIQLETLTTLMKALPEGGARVDALNFAANYAASILEPENRLAKYVPGTNRELEVALARANYICAFSEAQFLAGITDLATYTTTIETAYTSLSLSTSAKGLCDLGETMLSYNHVLSSHAPSTPKSLSSRWKALSLALGSFTSASKLPDVELGATFNVPKIHTKRGDAELLRFQLGAAAGAGYEPAVANAKVLLRNAETFYKGAEANARNLGLQDEMREAGFKGALVRALQGVAVADVSEYLADVRMMQEVLQDGLVSEDQLAALGIA